MFEIIEKSGAVLAIACKGNPILTTATIFMFYLFFTMFEAGIEKLIFGERFEHWLDPLFIGCVIAYSAYVVWACAEHNLSNV